MKLYKKALLILSLGLTLNSCLDLDPQDQLADGNLWGAADDFKYFATNFYGWTRDFTSVISDGAHSDWRSDLMTSSSVNMYSNGVIRFLLQTVTIPAIMPISAVAICCCKKRRLFPVTVILVAM